MVTLVFCNQRAGSCFNSLNAECIGEELKYLRKECRAQAKMLKAIDVADDGRTAREDDLRSKVGL